MGTLREIVFDSDHPARLARFWAAVFEGYALRPYDAAEISRLAALGLTPETDPSVLVDGPGPILCFQKLEGPQPRASRHHCRRPAHRDRQAGRAGGAGGARRRTTR